MCLVAYVFNGIFAVGYQNSDAACLLLGFFAHAWSLLRIPKYVGSVFGLYGPPWYLLSVVLAGGLCSAHVLLNTVPKTRRPRL